MQVSFETTVTVGDNDVSVTVEANWTPGYSGCMYARNGDPGDPPESPETEITAILAESGTIAYDSLSAVDQNRLDVLADEKAAQQKQYRESD